MAAGLPARAASQQDNSQLTGAVWTPRRDGYGGRERTPSFESHKRRDEPDAQAVVDALVAPPPTAPPDGDGYAPRQGVVLASPRRWDALGQTARHAGPWTTAPQTFVLDTPYPMNTYESRFADADEDKAALAAVAYSAGRATAAGPVAGMTTGHANARRMPNWHVK